MDKKFTAVGITTKNGITKVRFATDSVARQKSYIGLGHSIALFEDLERPMSKLEILQMLDGRGLEGDAGFAVSNKLAEMTRSVKKGEVKVKATKPVAKAAAKAKTSVAVEA
jgi:hypothetical protein